jgi:hypothetical protein
MPDRQAVIAALMAAQQPQPELSEADQAAMSPETFANPLVKHLLTQAAEIPQRAIQNSQFAQDTGTYDPRPTLEAAMLPMGAGGVSAVPAQAGEAVLGSGMARMRMIENADQLKEMANLRRAKGYSVGKSAEGHDFTRPEAEKGSFADLLKRTQAQWEADKARAIAPLQDVAPSVGRYESSLMSAADWEQLQKYGLAIPVGALGSAVAMKDNGGS